MIEDIKNSAPEERAGKTAIVIECIIKETLKLPPNEKIDHDQNFNELGVDSLMAMEMKGRIQKIVGGITIPISALQENRTIRKLSQYVANRLNAEDQPVLPLPEMMAADSILPEEIQANIESKYAVPSTWRGILVTGATGHLGVHLLPEIQRMCPDVKIYCLVRAKTESEAKDRIKEELDYYELSRQVDVDKMIAVAGNITVDKFGLDEEAYEKLATEIDAVIHCAVRSNHIENYYDGSKNDIRTVNVLGFHNILKFSTTHSTKHIMYTSSLLSLTEGEEDGSLPERFVSLDSYTKVDNAYLQSKCIAEALLSQATERGIPSTVFRIPALSTSTRNGIPTKSVNHGWNLFMAGTRIRKFPEFDTGVGFPMYPVDVAAKICIGIFLKDDSEKGVYNLLHDKPFSKEAFKDVAAECGFDFEFVPFEEWRKEMIEELNDGELGIFSSLYATNEKNISRIYDIHRGADVLLRSTKSNLKPSLFKVRKNFPEYEVVNEYSFVDLFRLQFRAHVRKQKTQNNTRTI